MRSLGRFILIIGATWLIVSVTVGSPVTTATRSAVEPRLVAQAPATTVTSAIVAPPTTVVEPSTGSAARVAGAPRQTAGRGARVATVAPPTWERFGGELTGPSREIATAHVSSVGVSRHPDEPAVMALSNPTSNGAPRVLPIIQESGDWLQVLLPIRPNSSMGWVRRADVDVSSVSHRIVIERAAHRIQVFNSDALVTEESVAVGRSSTPTPTGQFFTVELLQPSNPGGAYGPYAFTLSGYSDVYQTFGSGDGSVGLHGTNESSSIGRDASHGCVRVRNELIRYLASVLPIGTPVFIR
ncbi:MAG: hypothetical protein QOF21_2297 [Actinomycetota bacterium]|jgi:hypothetical protein